MKILKKKKFLKFYSVNFLAKYLGTTAENLLYLRNNHSNFFYFNPGVRIKNKLRDFYVAQGQLKKVLKTIDEKILSRIALPDSFQGGIKGKSLITNAKKHIGNSHMLKIDIKDFFPSISPDRVYDALRKIKINQEPAKLLSSLMTVDKPKAHLPQGFSTSPKVAALTLLGFESRLHALAVQYNWNYTFWVDDITISGNFPVEKFKGLIIKMLKQEGFEVNPLKVITLKRSDQLIVNSIVINKFPNIPKESRDEIKNILRLIVKYGPINFLSQKKITNPSKKNVLYLKNHLLGNIHHVMSINPVLGKKLKMEFTKIDWEK